MDDSGSSEMQIINECHNDEPEEQNKFKFKDTSTEAGDIFLMDFRPIQTTVEEPRNKLLSQRMDLKISMNDSDMLINFTEGNSNLPNEQLEQRETEKTELKGSLNKISPISSKVGDIKLLDEQFLTPLESHCHSLQPTYFFQTKGINQHSEYRFKSPPESHEQLFQPSVFSQIEGAKYAENSFTREFQPHGHFFHPSPKAQPSVLSFASQQSEIINGNFSSADISSFSFLEQMLKESFEGKQNSYAMRSSSIINITDKKNSCMDNRMNIKLNRESFEMIRNCMEDDESSLAKKFVAQQVGNMVFKQSSNETLSALDGAKKVRKLDNCFLSSESQSTRVTPLMTATAEHYRENISNLQTMKWEGKFEERRALKEPICNREENCFDDELLLTGLSSSDVGSKNSMFQNTFNKPNFKVTAVARDEKAQIKDKTNFTHTCSIQPGEKIHQTSSRNHNVEFEGNGLFKPKFTLENMTEKSLLKTSPEKNLSSRCSSPTNGEAIIQEAHSSVTDENDIFNSIVIEIYRKIARIFEIWCIIPLATSIESFLDLIELVSASAFCMMYYFATNTTPTTEGNHGPNSDLVPTRNSASQHLEQTRSLICNNIDNQSEETNVRYLKSKICRSSTSLISLCNDHNCIRNEFITSQLVISQNNEEFGGDSDRKLNKEHFPVFQRELSSMVLTSEGFDQRLVLKSVESNLIDLNKDLSVASEVSLENSLFKTVDEIFQNNDVNDEETCLKPLRESAGFDECLETVDTFDFKSVFPEEDYDEESFERGLELYDSDLVFKLKDIYISDEERDSIKTYPESAVSCKNKHCDICSVQENGSNVFVQFGDELGIGFLNGRELKIKSNSIELNNSVGFNSDIDKTISDVTTSKIKEVESSCHSDSIDKFCTRNLLNKPAITSENDLIPFNDIDRLRNDKENLIKIILRDRTSDQFQIHETDFDAGNIDTSMHSGDQFECDTSNRSILNPPKMQIAKITETLLTEIGNDYISDGLFINESAFGTLLKSRKLEDEAPENRNEMLDICSSAETLLDSCRLPAIKQSDPGNIKKSKIGTNRNIPTEEPKLNVDDKSDNLRFCDNERFQVLNHLEDDKMEKSEDDREGIQQADSCKTEEGIKDSKILITVDRGLSVVEEGDDLKSSNQIILQVLHHLEEGKTEESGDSHEGIQQSDSFKIDEKNILVNELPTLDYGSNIVEKNGDFKIANNEILQVLNCLEEGKIMESEENSELFQQPDLCKFEKINKANELLPTFVHEFNVIEEIKDLKISNSQLLQDSNDSEEDKMVTSDYNLIAQLSDQCRGSNLAKVRDISTTDNTIFPLLEQSRKPKMERSKDEVFETPSIQNEKRSLAYEYNDSSTSVSTDVPLSKLSGTFKMEDSKAVSIENLSVKDERCNLNDEYDDSAASDSKRLLILKHPRTLKIEELKDDPASVLLLSVQEEKFHLPHKNNDFENSKRKVFSPLKGSKTPKMGEFKDDSIEISLFQDIDCILVDENNDALVSDYEVLPILKQRETFNVEDSKDGSIKFCTDSFQDNRCNLTDENNVDVASFNEVLSILNPIETSKMEKESIVGSVEKAPFQDIKYKHTDENNDTVTSDNKLLPIPKQFKALKPKLNSVEIFSFQNEKNYLSDKNIDSKISDDKYLIDFYTDEDSSKDIIENADIKELMDFLIQEVENSLNKEMLQKVGSSENNENLYSKNYSLLKTVQKTNNIEVEINHSMLISVPIESSSSKIVITEKCPEFNYVNNDLDKNEFKVVDTTQETDNSSEIYSSELKDRPLSNEFNYDQNRMLEACQESVAFNDNEENESSGDILNNHRVLHSTEELANMNEKKELFFANNISNTDFHCETLQASEEVEDSECSVMNVSLEVNCSLNSLESLSSEDDEDDTHLHEIQDIDGNKLKIHPSLQGYRSLKESENYKIDNYGKHIEAQNAFSADDERFLESDDIQVKSFTDMENCTQEELCNLAFSVQQFKALEEEHSHVLTSTPATSSSQGLQEDELLSSEPFEPTSFSNNMFDVNLNQPEEMENEDMRKKRHRFIKHGFASVWKKIHKQYSSATIDKTRKYKKHQNDS